MSQELFVFLCVVFVVAFSALLYVLWQRKPIQNLYSIATHEVEVDGWKFHYHRGGQGVPMLLLHGIGANLYCWRWVLPILSRDFTVIAVDIPGFGQSSKPVHAKYGLDEQCERLLGFLDRLGVKKTHVVGNSMGGNIALWLAQKAPDRVIDVCVIGPAASPKLLPVSLGPWVWLSRPASLLMNRTAMRWAHRRTVSRKDRVDEIRVEQTFQTYGRRHDAVRSFMLATETIRDARLLDSLKDLKHKVLVLWGSRDRLVPRKVIDGLMKVLPEAEFFVHEGGGHHLQEDEPEWVAEKIRAHFR